MADVWIDEAACTGCGACVEACPAGAISMVADKARLNTELCTRCEICVEVCPVGAIHPVLEAELVPSPVGHPPAPHRAAPLAPSNAVPVRDVVVAAAVTAGSRLALTAVQALVRAASRWLAAPGTGTRLGSAVRPADGRSTTTPSAAGRGSAASAGRRQRARRRQRGRR